MNFDLTVLQKRLSDRGFQAFVCTNNQETINLISETILSENDSVVGIGNSMTLRELELVNILSSKTLFERNLKGTGEDERKALAGSIGTSVTSAFTAGIISQKIALKELKASNDLTGMWASITDEDIENADDSIFGGDMPMPDLFAEQRTEYREQNTEN